MQTDSTDLKLQSFDCKHCGEHFQVHTSSPFSYCPNCGMPSEELQATMEAFFEMIPLSPLLNKSVIQFKKFEYVAAARTSLIVVEETFRKNTGLSDHGVDLISKSFKFKLDSNGCIENPPLIRINDLETLEQRNEHEGIKLLCLGIIKGLRNIIAHHNANLTPKACSSIIMLADLTIDLITSGSILNKRVCVWTRVNKTDR